MNAVVKDEIRPPEPPGPATWLRKNLFANWYNSLLTIIVGGLVLWAVYAAFRWIFFVADWSPVTSRPLLYMVGQYPSSQYWRIGLALALVSFMFGVSWGIWGDMMRAFSLSLAFMLAVLALLPTESAQYSIELRVFLASVALLVFLGYLIGKQGWVSRRVALIVWILSPLVILILLRGIGRLLPVVPTNIWGGLLLTIVLAVGGIVLSFPIGVLLALGRRSRLPVISFFSAAFIEIVRGVPLIGILFMSSIIFPLFLPPEIRIDRLIRALSGITLFSAAYMAENIRGGLQAIPLGQFDAARALGLNNFMMTFLIALPQALQKVIPAIVGQFIALFKDTTLAAGVGLLELLSVAQSILQANPNFFGLQAEVYIFVAAVFWVFSYSLSFASRRVEAALGVGKR